MHLDLTDLRLFLRVAEAGSITGGAARANLALAAASARISAMEADLGVRLLDRGRRGAAPTPAGRALLHHARLVLGQVERLTSELGAYAGGLRGHVRLLANTAATSEFLPELLATFLAAHPSIDVDLEERLSWEIVEAIAAGRAELGIVADTVDLGALETIPFRLDRLVAVVPAGHRLAGERRLGFAALLGEPFVGLAEGSALQTHLAGHAARLGRPPHYRVRLRGFDAVCRMVERGVGVAVIPDAAARRCRRTMRIRRIALTDPWAVRQLTLCCRSRAELAGPARLLLAALATDPPGMAAAPAVTSS